MENPLNSRNTSKDLHGKSIVKINTMSIKSVQLIKALDVSYTQYLIKKIEQSTGLTFDELKTRYTQADLFKVCLFHVTTTKKAISTAFNLPIETMCRRKRELEKCGLLVQSTKKVICPITKHPAHLISTNPAEFDRLLNIVNPKNR
jgi:hypothetical protein